MKKSKFPEEQIAFALRQAETDTRVAGVCATTEANLYRELWTSGLMTKA